MNSYYIRKIVFVVVVSTMPFMLKSEICSEERLLVYWDSVTNQIQDERFVNCLNTLKEIEQCSKKLKNDYFYASSSIYIANFSKIFNEFDSSFYYLNKLEKEIGNLNIPKDSLYGIKADLYFMYGVCYYKKGWFEQSLEYYQSAINVLLEQVKYDNISTISYTDLGHNFSFGTVDLFNNIAMVYYKFGDYDMALDYFNIAVELLERDEFRIYKRRNLSMSMQNSGLCYLEKGYFEIAGDKLLKAFEIILNDDKGDNINPLSLIHKNLAR